MPRARALLFVFLGAACSGTPPSPHQKPLGPVAVQAVASEVGEGLYDVLVEGVGEGDLELELLLPDGATLVSGTRRLSGRGPRQTLVGRVRAPAGTLVGAGARPHAGASRVTHVRLGPTPPPAPAARVVLSPFGPVAEVAQ